MKELSGEYKDMFKKQAAVEKYGGRLTNEIYPREFRGKALDGSIREGLT